MYIGYITAFSFCCYTPTILAFGFKYIYVQVVLGKGPTKTAAPNSSNASATPASTVSAATPKATSEPEGTVFFLILNYNGTSALCC